MAEDESFCLFHCDSLPMAVAVAHVAEIAEVDALVRISLCPPRVAGLCPYHRQVVPVVALGKSPFRADLPMIDQRNAGKSTKEIVLIMQTSQGLWGILIDREGTFLTTQRPSRHEPRDEGDGIVSEGRIDHGGKTYALLEAESTWRGLRHWLPTGMPCSTSRWHRSGQSARLLPASRPAAQAACHRRL